MSDLCAIWAFDALDDEAVAIAECQHKPRERSPRPRHEAGALPSSPGCSKMLGEVGEVPPIGPAKPRCPVPWTSQFT